MKTRKDKIWLTTTECADFLGISRQVLLRERPHKLRRNSWKKKGNKYVFHKDRTKEDWEKNTATRHRPKSLPDKKQEKLTQAEQLKTIRESGLKIVSLNEAQTIKANYDAALKKLEYEIKKRELLPADEVRKILADIVLSARSKILAIKGKLAPLLKEFIADSENFGIAMDSVETAIRDILTEMAESGIEK